jgi:hypothetical protein
MASTDETKKGGCCGGRRHGPPTEEERRQREAEFKQEFLDEYRQRYGDALISAEQTWELYQAVDERWHAKMKGRHPHPQHQGDHPQHQGDHPQHQGDHPQHQGDHPQHHGGPPHCDEKRKQIFSELQQEFQKDFGAAHGASKINADQAWSLVLKVKQNKRGHRHGPGEHGRHSPPANQ